MNAQRRKEIDAIAERARELKADLEIITDAEREAFENMPESLQDGERGEKMQEAIDTLETADGNFDEMIENLAEAVQ